MAVVDETAREYLTLAEVHEELLSLLLRFDAFCREQGLRYSLDSGTLLGAVRHKGFIPWDDDLDINMPRPDYDRLRQLEGKLPDGMCLQTASNSAFMCGFSRICTQSVRAQEAIYEGVMDEMLWIDIFPTDGVPNDLSVARKAKRRVRTASILNVWAMGNHSKEGGLYGLARTVGGALLKLGDTRGHLLRTIDGAASLFSYDESERVGCIVGGEVELWTIPKEGYENFVEMEFEGHLLPCMGCWDEFLTALYGDYMQLPPEDKRATHCIKAWRV